MPLIVITGIPSSGKTTRALELKKYFIEQGKDVIVISEQEQYEKANFTKNNFYHDSHKEKQIRGILKSEVIKHLGPNNLVILDAGNYIKGYRYEIYCASKNNKCNQCTLQCLISEMQAYEINLTRPEKEKYSEDVFKALCMRYEYPEGKNRWDAPLITIQMHDELDYNEISHKLFQSKKPKPNKSTQNAPLSDTNYLYQLDKITSDITNLILSAKHNHLEIFTLPENKDIAIELDQITPGKLNMLRRQYITFSKMHTPDIKNIQTLFLQYLKSNLS